MGRRAPDKLYGPRAVFCADDGHSVWVADPGGRRVHVFDLEERTYTKITQVRGLPLRSPVDVAAGPEGTVMVCDSESVAIHLFSGDRDDDVNSLRLPEEIQRPVALHYAEQLEEIFVVDAAAHDIKVLDTTGRLLRMIGRRGSGPGEFNFPCDIVEYDGRLWVVDAGNHRIQALTPLGKPLSEFGREGDAPGNLALPKGIAFDSEGHAYVVDARFENVQVFDRSGRLLLFFGDEGTGDGEFWLPSGISIDSRDRIWVCDTYNGRLQVFDYLAEPHNQEVTP
ncbi:MAG: hypothetical protein JSU63_04215 [Phycisphaerales bacterium]|nr:MAG: hypothetical protein JSU63_04215 [Phycisphaerales bacterium]